MSIRVKGATFGTDVTILIDGESVRTSLGTTLAAAMLATGRLAVRVDGRGEPRGLYCNMGTCCECMVDLVQPDGRVRPVRACLADVAEGLSVRTRSGPRR
jgi:D-hydroxyproline dehydrogenase subunit gamma